MSQDCDISAEKTPKFLCFRDIPVRFGRYNKDSQIYQLVWQEHPHGDITNIISVKSLWQKYVEASFIFEWIPILEYKKINYGIDLP